MKIMHSIGLLGAATVAALGTVTMTGSTAFAGTPAADKVATAQQRVDTRATHIDQKMRALQTKIAVNKRLSSKAKADLQSRIARLRSETSAWRKQVDAARTISGVHAADPAHRTVIKDLAGLKAAMTKQSMGKAKPKQH
jgi:hypothetical protein